MPKKGMKPIRRKQLTEAAFRCIHQYGFSGTTVKRVAQKAGMSVGIVSHYFGSKNGLLEATMRRLLKDLGAGLKTYAVEDDDPKSRIVSIINSNFAKEQVSPEAVTVWLAFWGQALHTPELRRLQNINLARLRSNLRYSLRDLLPRDKAYDAAEGLAALIDGLWLRGAFAQDGIQREHARKLCLDYLDQCLKEM